MKLATELKTVVEDRTLIQSHGQEKAGNKKLIRCVRTNKKLNPRK